MRIGIASAGDLEGREFARFRPRGGLGPGGIIRGPYVHPTGREILTGHLSVVTGGAGALDRAAQADRVDVRRVAQPKLAVDKYIRPSGDGCAVIIGSFPRIEKPEDRIVVVVAEDPGAM